MSHPDIRPALPEEATELTSIAWDAKRHWGYPEAWLTEWREALTITPADIQSNLVLVAERSSVVAGFAVLKDAGEFWSLEHLWVRPEHHGAGVGWALLEAVVSAAGALRGGFLRIESDPFAVGFYESCGARRVGMVPAPVLGEPRELPLLELPVPAA